MELAPSILAANWSNLKEEIKCCSDLNIKQLHIDVMDGNFVPQISFGAKFIADMRAHSSLFFDVHIMVLHPETHVDSIIEAGADALTFHIEATNASFRLITYIRQKYPHVKVGVAINPQTNIDTLVPLLDLVDIVLLMSVEPGYGGQKFIPFTINKIKQFNEMIKKYEKKPILSIDGGVNKDNSKILVENGVDILVMGSAFFNEKNKKKLLEYISNYSI